MARDAFIDQLVVGVYGVEQLHAFGAHFVHRGQQVRAAHGDVLNALALVFVQVFLYLTGFFIAFFIDRDAYLAAGAGHGLALDTGDLAFDIEVAYLAKVE